MTNPVVTLSGTQYTVPEFTIAQLETVLAFVMRWSSSVSDLASLNPMKVQDMTRAVYHGVIQPNTQMTWEDFRKQTIPMYELVAAFAAVKDQTHMMKPSEGPSTGEPTSPTGTPSPQN